VLVTGCATTPSGDYCDLTRPKYFESVATVDWLDENDRGLLAQIVVDNEVYREFCGG
jgi:hypothetical protein